jgi:hypothetical protein
MKFQPHIGIRLSFRHILYITLSSFVIISGCVNRLQVPDVQQWTTFEITLTSEASWPNGYTDVEV